MDNLDALYLLRSNRDAVLALVKLVEDNLDDLIYDDERNVLTMLKELVTQ